MKHHGSSLKETVMRISRKLSHIETIESRCCCPATRKRRGGKVKKPKSMEMKTLIIHKDLKNVVDCLKNEQAGELFKAILDYANGVEPEITDGMVNIAFIPIKQALDRDVEKYSEVCERRSAAGKKGMKNRWHKDDDITNDNNVICVNNKNNKAISEITNITNTNTNTNTNIKSNKDKRNIKESHPDFSNDCKTIVDYLNQKCGTNYRYNTEATKKSISGRLNEGYTVNDFMTVIDKKSAEWLGSDMEQYLNPTTLFRPANFEKYLNQNITPRKAAGTNKSDVDDYFKNLIGG